MPLHVTNIHDLPKVAVTTRMDGCSCVSPQPSPRPPPSPSSTAPAPADDDDDNDDELVRVQQHRSLAQAGQY